RQGLYTVQEASTGEGTTRRASGQKNSLTSIISKPST
ncbi:hypothetical protein MPER_09592, partial [Moniliophthora perniciosa FA553]